MNRSTEAEPTEAYQSIKIGDLNVHFLAFDHVDGISGVPHAMELYRGILNGHQSAVPMIEYFPPEITSAIQAKTGGELSNIQVAYGTFVNNMNFDRVLVSDPAYCPAFGSIDVIGFFGGLFGFGAAGKAVEKQMKWLGYLKRHGAVERRDILKILAIAGLAGFVGLSLLDTALQVIVDGSTGTSKIDPPKLPLTITGETEFRILTIWQSLKQLGDNVDKTGIDNVVLIYPQAHIDRILQIYKSGNLQDFLGKMKFDMYKLMFNSFGLLKIRDWRKRSGIWKKGKEIPINFDL